MSVEKQLLVPLQLQSGLMKDRSWSKMKGEEYSVLFHYKMYLGPDPGTTEVIRNIQLVRSEFP